MARVPYTPVPDVTPQSPGESISISTPGAAFGENIGNALQHLGTTTEQVGGEIFQRAIALQDLANETAARNKVVDFTNQAAQLQADFDTKTGIDAKNALPGHLKAIADLRNAMRGQLGSPMAQRFFDQEAASFQNRTTFSSAAHAGQQFKQYNIQGYEATRDMALRNVEDYPDDPSYYDKQKATAIDAAKHATMMRAGVFDENDPIVQNAVQETEQGLIASKIRGIAHDRPLDAQKMLEDNRTKLGDKYEPLQALVETRGMAVASSNIIDGVLAKHKQDDGSYDATMADMEAEAKAQAKDQFPKMPLLPQHVMNEIKSRTIQENFARQTDKRNNEQDFSKLLLEHPEIMDVQGFQAAPGGQAIVNKMDAKEKLALSGKIRLARSQENSQEWAYNKVRANGLSSDNVELFLQQDFTKWNLEPTERLRLQQKQTELAKKPLDDPRVTGAMSILTTAFPSQLEAMGVKRSERNDPDSAYTHFVGSLQEGLQTWQEDHKKPATYDDIIGPIFKDLMTKQPVSRSFFHPFTTEQYSFQQFQKPLPTEVPPEFITKATNDVIKAGGVNPTDDQIYRAYLRTQYIKLFGKSQGDGTGSGPTPPTSR